MFDKHGSANFIHVHCTVCFPLNRNVYKQHFKKIMSSILMPVLADIYTQPVQLADFYVSNITDRKFTAALVK